MKLKVHNVMPGEKLFIQKIFAELPYQGTDDEKEKCLRLLYRHSRDVADLALEIASHHPELPINVRLLEESALLHDVGVVWTYAPSIHCHGTEPYIRHGELGRAFLAEKGLAECSLVAARHTGAGISAEEIALQKLPLEGDALPVTLEEKLVCYADKFFSKSQPERRKSHTNARRSLEKFGPATLQRFDALTALFGEV